MKKILAILMLSFVLLSTSKANSSEENSLYKAIVLSRYKIEKDYWKNYNKTIQTFFENLRKNQDINRVNELDEKLKKLLSQSSKIDEKRYNLIVNLYSRNKLLKDFHLKWVKNTSSTSSNIITWNNSKVITWKNETKEENKKTNSISDIIAKWDNSLSKNNFSKEKKSLSYAYKIPKNWKEQKLENGETILTNEDGNQKNSVVFVVTDFENFSSFTSFKEEFKKEVLKDGAVRNFSESVANIAWKDSPVLNYSANWDEKSIYLVEHNSLVLIMNVTKKTNIDISEIIKSIKIEN